MLRWVSYINPSDGRVLFTGKLTSETTHSCAISDFTGTCYINVGRDTVCEADSHTVARILSTTMPPSQDVGTLPAKPLSQQVCDQFGPPGSFKVFLRGNRFTDNWHLAITTDDRWFWFREDKEIIPT